MPAPAAVYAVYADSPPLTSKAVQGVAPPSAPLRVPATRAMRPPPAPVLAPAPYRITIKLSGADPAAPAGLVVGSGHFGGRARPRIGQRDGVVTGFLQQSGDECADLAGAQDQYPMHRVVSRRK